MVTIVRLLVVVLGLSVAAPTVMADPSEWRGAWPYTDFNKHSVGYEDIISGGPPKDGIPPIDVPTFDAVAAVMETKSIPASEPVIALAIGDDWRAYPLRILIWHEIVNDTVGGIPVTVTYCPLSSSVIVFDRRVDGRVLDFGTTGKLRRSDLVMYDRQTESWWQQFVGEAIVGVMTGKHLRMLPVRVESMKRFAERAPQGKVLRPSSTHPRPYGYNPYRKYDTSVLPILYRGPLPKYIGPMDYLVAVGNEAWPFETLRKKGRIVAGDLILTWTPGQNSALDAEEIASGRDIGNIVVQRRTPSGLVDEVHNLIFAFVFHAFRPKGTVYN